MKYAQQSTLCQGDNHGKNVPRPVWEYTLGGYQVLKKWLSYREQTLLGRPLTVDEVTYFRDVIRSGSLQIFRIRVRLAGEFRWIK